MSNDIRALVLLNLLNSLLKRDEMLGKPRILSLFLDWLNKFNKHENTHERSSIFITIARMQALLHSAQIPNATILPAKSDSDVMFSL